MNTSYSFVAKFQGQVLGYFDSLEEAQEAVRLAEEAEAQLYSQYAADIVR